MSVIRSGYYKWRYRQEHPTMKMISRQSDIKLIKEIHAKHPSHGYRWINTYARNKYGVVWSNNHVNLCCKYENIKSQGKHYRWNKPDEEHEKFNNLVWNGWKYLSRPYEVIVFDMTAFKVKSIYYELTMYFDAWNKEIIGYGLVSRKGDTRSYYDGLNQVLNKIKEEVMNLHTAVYEKFGYEMKYIRPPKGECSERTISYTNSLGYTTVMWSLAYDDWDENKQGRESYGKEKVLNNLHNGAIILLHSNSKDNANILDDIIKKAKEMGYEFKSLDEFER